MHGNNHDSDELDEEYGEEDVDIDAPRVAQWMDDEKLDDVQETESSEDESQDEVDDLGEGPSHQINMVRFVISCDIHLLYLTISGTEILAEWFVISLSSWFCTLTSL